MLAAALFVMLAQPVTRDDAITLARDALAHALDRAAEEAEVRRVDPAAWESDALGCPQAGSESEQRTIPGYRVWLSLDGSIHRVHVGDGRAVVCGRALKALEDLRVDASEAPAEPIDESLEAVVEEVRADLAGRLGIDLSEIAVLEAESVVWPNGSLGCPRPGMVYPQVQVDGVRIRLRAQDREYAYHGGGSRSPFLCESPEA